MSEQQRRPVATWFEIPAADFSRATRFYEAIMGTALRPETIGDTRLAIFPHDPAEPSGAVVAGPQYRPGGDGAVIYLNCHGVLDAVLGRIEGAGGRIALPRTELPGGMGAYAHIIDTEGNRVGLGAVN